MPSPSSRSSVLAEQRAARHRDRVEPRRSRPAPPRPVSAMCTRWTSSAKPHGRQGAAEAAEQVVVAAAAAERRSPPPGRRPRTPRPCSSRARAPARGRRSPGRPRRARRAARARRAGPAAAAERPAQALEHLRAAARARAAAASSVASRVGRGRASRPRAPAPTRSRRDERLEQRHARLARARPSVVEQAAVQRRRRPRPRGGAAARRRRAPRTDARAPRPSPSGAGDADQLDARLEELARLRRAAAARPVGVREVAEPQRRLGVARSGWPPRARSGSSCRSAAPARCPARRTSGSAGAAPRARRRGAAPPRTRAPACRPRRSRRRSNTARMRSVDRAQLAHLVRQHVARAAGNADRPSRRSVTVSGRAALRPQTRRSVATRSMRAPERRSRSSIRS